MSRVKKREKIKANESGGKRMSLQQKLKISLLIMTIVALFALSFSYFTQRPSDASGSDWGKLKVQTIDKYSNVISNVNISVWWNGELIRTGFSDNEGSIAFPHLYFDWYNLTVEKVGFKSGWLYFNFDEGQKKTFTISYLNFSLTLNITEYDIGAIVSNATIQVYRYDHQNNYEEFYTSSNDSGIAVLLDLEFDEYALIIYHPAYFNYSTLFFLDENIYLVIELQKIPGEPEPDPLPEPEPSLLNLTNLAIGIGIGLVFSSAVLWFFILQRKLREGEPPKKYRSGV